METERLFIQFFALRERRQRYLELLSRPNRRRKFLRLLNHRFEFDTRFARSGGPFFHLGPGTLLVHVMADSHPLDSLDVPLGVAREQLPSSFCGYIVIADPRRLALYQPEAPSGGILLKKSGTLEE